MKRFLLKAVLVAVRSSLFVGGLIYLAAGFLAMMGLLAPTEEPYGLRLIIAVAILAWCGVHTDLFWGAMGVRWFKSYIWGNEKPLWPLTA